MSNNPTPRDRVTDTEIARMVALRGLGYTYTEIATHCGRSTNTISRHLTEVETRAKAATNPYEVFGEYVEELLTVEVALVPAARPQSTGNDRRSA